MPPSKKEQLESVRGAVTTDDEAFRRFDAHVPKGTDAETLILKAHLVVEESLRLLVREFAVDPDSLYKADLTFYKLVHIARAFLPVQWRVMWNGVLDLNQARNDLAHNLDRDLSTERLHRLHRLILGEGERGYEADGRLRLTHEQLVSALRTAIMHRIHAQLWVARRTKMEERAASGRSASG